jgi:hypothetical protein
MERSSIAGTESGRCKPRKWFFAGEGEGSRSTSCIKRNAQGSANLTAARTHNRTPVVFKIDDAEEWLDAEPLPADRLAMHRGLQWRIDQDAYTIRFQPVSRSSHCGIRIVSREVARRRVGVSGCVRRHASKCG